MTSGYKQVSGDGNTCPCCGHTHWKKYKPPLPHSPIEGFRLVPDRQCQQCQSVWSPPCSAALQLVAVCCLALLLAADIVGIVLTFVPPLDRRFIAILIGGAVVFAVLLFRVYRMWKLGTNTVIVREAPRRGSVSRVTKENANAPR